MSVFFFRSESDGIDYDLILKIVEECLGSCICLGGGNSNIFYVHPDPWGNDPI